MLSSARRKEFANLFTECVSSYLKTDAGRAHTAMYPAARAAARGNLDDVMTMRGRGKDVTDAVLLRLLPHADTVANRKAGALVHIAPAITGNIKLWYERAGRTRPEDWPTIAAAILRFIERCIDDPTELAAACEAFAALPTSKGFQSGMLSPTLNALNPDAFRILNNKVRTVINYLAGTKHNQSLVEYPAANETLRQLVSALGDEIRRLGPPDMRADDVFDLFCHWLVGVKKHPLSGNAVRYWKIAPGEGAWNWDACRDGGFVAVGWDELGDLSLLTEEEYRARQKELVAEREDWTVHGSDQAWRLARDIHEGDRIVANRGTTEVLGIGTVSGGYYYVSGVRHGHRLPVEWEDITPRRVDEYGWRRTLVELDRAKFEAIQNAPPIGERRLAEPFSRIFADWDEAGWALGLLRESIDRLGLKGPADERYTLSLLPQGGAYKLRLNYGWGMVIDFRGPATMEHRTYIVLLEEQAKGLETYYRGSFKMPKSDPVLSMYLLPVALLRDPGSPVREAYLHTLDYMRERFAHYGKSPYRSTHQETVAAALYDGEKLDLLLGEGLTNAPSVAPGWFTEETIGLLAGLSAEPTKSYYQDHRDELKEAVEQPFERLLAELAAELSPEASALLETEKALTSRFLKNDFGKGGAWGFYWGAFYPKGGKRTTDAQLYVWMSKDELRFGFYISDYGDAALRRFQRNVEAQRETLGLVLGGTFAEIPGLTYGSETEPLTYSAWLRTSRPLPRAGVAVPADEVLTYSREELVRRIGDAFTGLFPLMLLATSDNPMPAIRRYLGEEPDHEIQPEYPLAICAEDTGHPLETLQAWLMGLERKGQAILYGPPGTGKTYMAEHLAQHLVGGSDGFIETIQFHPAYAYEDFMLGIRPREREDGGLHYPVVPGHFVTFCRAAAEREGTCVLIIDEINRAELSRVFGELMYLLEYRDQRVRLSVDGQEFAIPKNVRIIGTMNTADRSIALVDHALRRRFAFIGLYPRYDVLAHYHACQGTGFPVDRLITVLKRLNEKIGDPNYAVGITFFMRQDLHDSIANIWQMEIEPYLEEYFFDRRSRVDAYRWHRVTNDILS